MAKSSEQLILEKLDQLLGVLTISVTKGLRQREQMVLLNRAGLPPKEIARLLGTTPNTVSKELSTLRKAKGTNASRKLKEKLE